MKGSDSGLESWSRHAPSSQTVKPALHCLVRREVLEACAAELLYRSGGISFAG